MSRLLYRLLLHALPRARRERDAAEMTRVFGDLLRAARAEHGWRGAAALWVKEAAALIRFAARERLTMGRRTWPLPSLGTGGHLGAELKWAARSVRARLARAVLIVGLLGLALAANTVTFSAADALLFRRVPYSNADRLLTLGNKPTRLIAEWREHIDLFESVHGYLTRPVFLVSQDQPEVVDLADVTPGLIEALGASVRFGRLLQDADVRDASLGVVTISDRLARARFGDSARAIGQQLETTAGPLLVVGVMPPAFRFPSSGFDVWRGIDLRNPRLRSMTTVALAAQGRSIESIADAARQRSAAAAARAGLTPSESIVRPLFAAGPDDRSRRLLSIVIAAALCLLLTACANVASLELAGAVSRARAFGIQAALGASRGSLIRGALFEGLLLVIPAAILATVLANLGASLLAANVPTRIFDSVNPIDLDVRALAFLAIAAIGTWLLISAPLAVFAMRRRYVDLLNSEGRSSTASAAGTRVRHALTAAEVALAVLLLAGSVLYARSYRSMLAIDKGFDTRSLWALTLTLPTQSYPTPQARQLLEDDITRRLQSRRDVESIWGSGPLPPSRGEAHRATGLEIDGQLAGSDRLAIGIQHIDRRYFPTLRIPLRAGRPIDSSAHATDAVVDESFARAFWPTADPLGRSFRISKDFPVMTVIGVAGHVFNVSDDLAGASDSFFQIYVPRQPPPISSAQPAMINDLPLYGSLDFALRLGPTARPSDVAQTVRAIDSRFRLRLRSFDDVYAARFEDTRLAASLVSAFAGLAFLLATAGIYGVMAFLVAGRRREIGIRMALGADRGQIGRMVLGSSTRLTLLGALLGILAALAASRWTTSQFFGVAATHPSTYAIVAALVVVAALTASWGPARRAARTDPAITLRE